MTWIIRGILIAIAIAGIIALQFAPANYPPGPHCKLEWSQGVQYWKCLHAGR